MSFTVMAVGDLVVDEPDPASFFAPARETLGRGDVVIGHIEVPHSTSTAQVSTDVPAPPADPAALSAVAGAGFHVVTLAGNHVYDVGDQGVADTIKYATEAGMATAGAGLTLEEARRPAVVERDGLRIGVLSYNCVGPRESWATSRKPGCAYVKVLTHYELDHASPGGPPAVYTFADPASLERMAEDVAALAAEVDIVTVSMHKGVGHTPAVLAMYERPVAHAAIDAGAHAVFAHHAHIMRGIEMYRGRPIYHGLGNFVTVTHALTPTTGDAGERAAWARRRVELYGFAPDPDMPYYPFHPESRNTAIAVCRFDRDDQGEAGLVSAGIVPCWIDGAGRPVPLGDDEEGRRVVSYIEHITRQAGLKTEFHWEGNEVVLRG
ncbi:CapA family protein [Microbispora sp. CA-135349]|uniref:CapA family protein n=1 Tax=Microbispora sp. CA-135349 TaxID=3239953 RepID=UPI003D8EA8E7